MLKKHFRKYVLTSLLILPVGLMTNCNTRPEVTRISINQPNEVNKKTMNSPPPLNDLSKIETVSYCELIKNPSKYDHKIVRVRAIYFTAFENTLLYDQTCEPGKPPTAPDKVPAETWAEWDKSFVSKGDSEEAKLNRQLNGFGRKDVTLIGKFNSTNEHNDTNQPNLFGHLNCCQFQFQIMRLEAIVNQNDVKPRER
jgi:hypothetical protein